MPRTLRAATARHSSAAPDGAEHRYSLCQQPAGQGPCRAGVRYVAGPVGQGTAWLPGFVEDYNKRFGRAPVNAKDLHRPLSEADDLDEILAWREERKLTRNLTL